MDRNTILGLLLIAGILIGYSIITKPSKEQVAEQAELQRIRDSVAIVEQFKIQELQKQQEEVANAEKNTSAKTGQPVAGTRSIEDSRDKYGAFAEGAEGSKEFIILENDLIKIRISTLGGRPYSVQLKEYQTYDSLPLILFDGDSTVFGLNFFAQNRKINTNELYFTPGTKETYIDASTRPANLSMRLYAGKNRYIEYVYSLALLFGHK